MQKLLFCITAISGFLLIKYGVEPWIIETACAEFVKCGEG